MSQSSVIGRQSSNLQGSLCGVRFRPFDCRVPHPLSRFLQKEWVMEISSRLETLKSSALFREEREERMGHPVHRR